LRIVPFILTLAVVAPAACADIVAHSLVAFGDISFTTNEQYASPSAAAQLSYTSPGLFNGESSSHCEYGLVGGTVSISSVDASYPTNRALAEATFHDTLTISGPTGAGFIQYEYSLIGEAFGEADAHLFLNHQGDPSEELAGEATESGIYTSEFHNIIFGTPFEHGLSINIAAFIGLGETEEAAADFYAYMSAIHIFDANMTPISSYSIVSESGTTYPLPAPSTLALLACGGLILHRRRRD